MTFLFKENDTDTQTSRTFENAGPRQKALISRRYNRRDRRANRAI